MNLRTLSLPALLVVAALSRADGDLRNDFSVATNPNGTWTYGSTATLGGAFSTFTLKDNIAGFDAWHGTEYGNTLPLIGMNVTGAPAFGVPAGDINMHPGTSLYAVSRFTVPAAGSYALSGSFGVGESGAVDVHVLANGVNIFDGVDGATFSLAQTLATGDTLDFVVGNAGNVLYDSTPVEAHITHNPVPEPGTFAALGLGAFGLLRRRKGAR